MKYRAIVFKDEKIQEEVLVFLKMLRVECWTTWEDECNFRIMEDRDKKLNA